MFLQFGVADARVVDGFQLLLEHLLHGSDVLEGDGALLEVALGHLRVDDFIHQVADAFFVILRQAARGGFHRVGHHQDGLLLGEGIRAGIGEQSLVGFLAGMFVLPRDVEVLGLPLAVVGGDEVLDDLGQVVLLGQLHAAGDVADDHLGALFVGQVLVRIDATPLVLGEEHGVLHLADVVVEGAGTHQLALGPDAIGRLGCQVGHLHGVLEGTRHGLGHAAQQRVVDVGQLDQRHVRGEAEGLLQHKQQRVGEEQEDAVDDEVHVHPPVSY